jgi:hypothetical protein
LYSLSPKSQSHRLTLSRSLAQGSWSECTAHNNLNEGFDSRGQCLELQETMFITFQPGLGKLSKIVGTCRNFQVLGKKKKNITVLNSCWHRRITSTSAFAFGSNIEFVEWKNTSYN